MSDDYNPFSPRRNNGAAPLIGDKMPLPIINPFPLSMPEYRGELIRFRALSKAMDIDPNCVPSEQFLADRINEYMSRTMGEMMFMMFEERERVIGEWRKWKSSHDEAGIDLDYEPFSEDES